ncbi:UDP-2,4-diacetamido-2,4,6-trideoxy-beta-L-altropyranose hydrolase [Rhodopirellula sp. UBA1907]|uniref:UDP-2,4-diacetamido-2,4, 6-trideoxy-beta-L-altropyranose hydrolase n=1 Tax=Rhodopirellula sp. UBA1907 TaxID=1947381 RepID=UPI00257B3575|nr:UDP-2,4-diacetamido-2,4,6-trideoxy-beta-L-altropyranose hydrolase [Rhodopirellula sp. UBA1907]
MIRVDASATIGAGHVMRCLALGQAWQNAGGDVTFAYAKILESIADRVRREGFELANIDCEIGSEIDAKQLLRVTHDRQADALVIDGYRFSVNYHQMLQESSFTTLAIDDHGHLPEYRMDFVLNQNLGASSDLYPNVAPHTELLLGTEFTLLRQEFTNASHPDKANSDEFRILVTLGGADPDNILDIVAEALTKLADSNLRFRLISGTLNDNHDNLVASVQADSRFEVVRHVDGMSDAYEWADFAVCAGGSTNWEMCCFGIPRVVIVLAENQELIAEALQDQGIALNVGDTKGLSVDSLCDIIESTISNTDFLESSARIARATVDGRGAQRVVQRIRESKSSVNKSAPQLGLRPATYEDWRILLEWRNDPETRSASRQSKSVTETDHCQWLKTILACDANQMMIAEVNGQPVGTVRLDGTDPSVISWTVAPNCRGKGYGKQMVKLMIRNTDRRINAVARTSNLGSCRIAIAAGFRITKSDQEWTEFTYVPERTND